MKVVSAIMERSVDCSGRGHCRVGPRFAAVRRFVNAHQAKDNHQGRDHCEAHEYEAIVRHAALFVRPGLELFEHCDDHSINRLVEETLQQKYMDYVSLGTQGLTIAAKTKAPVAVLVPIRSLVSARLLISRAVPLMPRNVKTT